MDEGKGIKEKTVFLSYLNDNNETISTYVTLLRKSDMVIVFQTHGNIITLPMSRVLKIKEKSDEGDDNDY